MRILFVCKKRHGYGEGESVPLKSGLYNSTELVASALRRRSLNAKVVVVNDNNDIDREVTAFRPHIVIIEALWVVPEKFDVLKRLHPRVKWFVHIHSDVAFLANEGVAMKWLPEYTQRGVEIIVNARTTYENLGLSIPKLHLLPNVYLKAFHPPIHHKGNKIHIGCFGAIRPMKNQLIQALAAIQFAREKGKELFFHVNGTRVERGGEAILRNLRDLFVETENATLVEHDWIDPECFVEHLSSRIDLGMQVSMSETFNIVSADYVAAGLPIVVSREVDWASSFCRAPYDSLPDIVDKMHFVWNKRFLIQWNQYLLKWHSENALDSWVRFLWNARK